MQLTCCVLLIYLTSLSYFAQAQDATIKTHNLNSINFYVGIIDANLNYERTLHFRESSQSKIRLGCGSGKFFTAGEGKYLNLAYAYFFSREGSHLELNAGAKIMVTNSIENPKFSQQVIPDFFIGYRFEKPAGGLIFRLGLNYPTLLNVGLGYGF